MPGLDKSGPTGQGSQTGRKQGNCNNGNGSVINEIPRKRGLRLGRGFKNQFGQGEENTSVEGRGQGREFGRKKRQSER